MKNTLKVTIHDAIYAHSQTGQEGKAALEYLFGNSFFKVAIITRIRHFDDVLKELEISHDDFYKNTHQLSEDELAYRKLKLIAKCLNEGWAPDFKNKEEDKYWPWFYFDNAGSFYADASTAPSYTSANFGSRLCFKTEELALYAATQFLEVYKEFIEQ